MSSDKKTTEFYKRLLSQLQEDTTWPSLYLYKFIVPAEEDKINAIKDLFKDNNAEINTRTSSKGTFASVSIKAIMETPEEVIKKYKEVSIIEGVISL